MTDARDGNRGTERGDDGIDLAQSGARLGPMLEIDVRTETLVGPTATGEIKALLKGKYRKPYVVPEKV